MEKWRGKVAIVTGGNSGNGFATLKKLAQEGIIVVGFDIAIEAIEKLKDEKNLKIHCYKCDITNDDLVGAAFDWVEKTLGGVDILVNNAGMFKDAGIFELHKPITELTKVIDLNFTALIRCSRYAMKSMESRDSLGYIININSVCGHKAFAVFGDFHIGAYPGTKFAVTATTEVMRMELINMGNKKVRVSSLSPGVVKTNIFEAAGLSKEKEDAMLRDNPHMQPEDIADNVAYLLSTPPHVNITEITVRSTGELI